MSSRRSPWVASLVALAVLVAGCGSARQDAHEPKGTFTVKVVRASFPSSQAVSRQIKFELEVRNAGTRTIPNLVVSIDSFSYRSEYPELAEAQRPVWIIDQGPGKIPRLPVRTVPIDSPGNDVTPNSNTWSAGAVPPGQTRTFVWYLTPVKSGVHTVHYTVAAGLFGRARAALEGGVPPASGSFTVNVAPAPRVSHVDPSTGALVAGPLLIAP